MRVFVSSKVNGHHQETNRKIKQLLEEIGCAVYLPQDELPLDSGLSSTDILTSNEVAIDNCNVVVAVCEALDVGGAMELGRARAFNKPIVMVRVPQHEKSVDMGKMLEGLWQCTPSWNRARSLEELKKVIEGLK